MASASNWVDRNEPAERKIARCLAVYLGRKPAAGAEEFSHDALTLLHMVSADGSEVQVASYVRSIERRIGYEAEDGALRRTLAIALWHIAKAGLVRDRLVALATEHAPPTTSEGTSLSTWLTEILLREPAAGSVTAPPVADRAPKRIRTAKGRIPK